jgi:Fe2+ transport system protein B
MNNEKAYRNLLALDFRAKIRREIEERQKQEEIERQKKREEAEKRRQQIVERMRQKKEEEERAIREAEQALKRAEMERLLGIELQLRKEQVYIYVCIYYNVKKLKLPCDIAGRISKV